MQPSGGLPAPQHISHSFLFLMKRVLLFISSSLLLAGSAQAQIGVRAGGNTGVFTKSSPSYMEEVATHRQLGYQVGIFYQAQLSKHLSLVPEVQFSRERFSVKKNRPLYDSQFGSEYDQSLSYLTLPILLRGSLGAFYVEAGPQLSFLVGGRAEGTELLDGGFVLHGSPAIPVAIKEAATDSYHRFDAGPCVGVGVKLPAGLGIGVRAYWGLTKLTTDKGYSVYDQTYAGFQHRQTLQASFTYQLAAR